VNLIIQPGFDHVNLICQSPHHFHSIVWAAYSFGCERGDNNIHLVCLVEWWIAHASKLLKSSWFERYFMLAKPQTVIVWNVLCGPTGVLTQPLSDDPDLVKLSANACV
jgi:hypothetical protein